MPNNKLKRAISVTLSLSLMTSAPQIGNAADLVPANSKILLAHPFQSVIVQKDSIVNFSMKSIESKSSNMLKALKSTETENVVKQRTGRNVQTGSDGSIEYTYDSSADTLTISGSGTMDDYSNSNYTPWKDYRFSTKAVKIENGVTSIGNCAFSDFNSLTSIAISDSVTSIGTEAFSHCESLTSITIPNKVRLDWESCVF